MHYNSVKNVELCYTCVCVNLVVNDRLLDAEVTKEDIL